MVDLPVAGRSARDGGHIVDLDRFARDLAEFLLALGRIDATDGPPAGAHSFFRGASPATYDAETRTAIAMLGDRLDVNCALAIWEQALESRWPGPPVWVHGDVTGANLLVSDGRLSSVIDFGCCAVGDPSCDLAIAWTFLEGAAGRSSWTASARTSEPGGAGVAGHSGKP